MTVREEEGSVQHNITAITQINIIYLLKILSQKGAVNERRIRIKTRIRIEIQIRIKVRITRR